MASLRWKQTHNTIVPFHKENLALGKISKGVSWQLFKCVYCLWNSASSRWHTSEVLAAYWRWQHAMLPDDTGVPSYRGSLFKGRRSVAAPLASVFCKSDHLHLSISHFWPVNVVKCCHRKTNSQPNLQDEARKKVCFSQIGPAGTPQLLPRGGRNLRATIKVQLFEGRVAQDFQQVCGSIGTGVILKAPGVIKKGTVGIQSSVGRWHFEKGTFMPSKPQSSKNLAFVGGRPHYHLDGAKCKILFKPQKILAW